MSTLDQATRMTTADWAVQSKHPGRAMGYTLVAGSGDRERAARLIQAGMTGTASDENRGRIDQMPWFSFVTDDSDEPALGVVVRSWSAERDGTGRTITPSRLVLLPWPRQAGGGPGFVELTNVVRSISWNGVDGSPSGAADGDAVELSVPSMDARLCADTIDEVGFEWVLAVAVALLDGESIVIVIPDNLSLTNRVKVLDAICGLLPYGCRSWASAATWARDHAEHAMRLSFAASARAGQRAIPFTDAIPSVQLRTHAVRDYHRELQVLRAKDIPTLDIVAHLAVMNQPLPPGRIAEAVTHLRDLRLPEAVLEEVEAGHGDPARVDRVLRTWDWSRLDARARGTFIGFLAECVFDVSPDRRGRARATLEENWQPAIRDHLADEVCDRLEDGRRESAQRLVAAALEVSAEIGDGLAAAVLQRAASNAALAARAVDLMISARAVVHDSSETLRVLACAPEVGARWLRLFSARQDFRAFLDEFEPYRRQAGAEWLRHVSSMVAGAPIEPAVAALPDAAFRLLLDLAVPRRQVMQLLSSAPETVLRLAFADGMDSDGAAIAGLVAREAGEATTPVAMACTDLLMLHTDQRLRYLAEGVPPLDGREYLDALHAVWLMVPEPAQERLAERFPGAVVGGALTRSSFATLNTVTKAVDSPLLNSHAVKYVAERLAANPERMLDLMPLGADWAGELKRYAPQYAWILGYDRLRGAAVRTETSAPTLADEYRRFRTEHDGPSAAAVRAIAPWFEARASSDALAFLWRFLDDGTLDPLGREVHAALLQGAGGHGLAQSFEAYIAQQYEKLAELNRLTVAVVGQRARVAEEYQRPTDESGTGPRGRGGAVRRVTHGVVSYFGFGEDRGD